MFVEDADVGALASFATILFNIPATITSVERNFSNKSRFHTKSRCQLGHRRVEKLFSINFNTKHKDKKTKRTIIDVDGPFKNHPRNCPRKNYLIVVSPTLLEFLEMFGHEGKFPFVVMSTH